jgi:hypothetical protein
MRWAGHVARLENNMNAYNILVENLKLGDHLGDLCIDGRIIQKWVLGKWGESV